MDNSNKVIIDKNVLKGYLGKKEEISKSLSRFIDNSIEARNSIRNSKNSCEINIEINEELISISDNSGGISNEISGNEIFRIGISKGENISGLGIKVSLCSLGSKMVMTSNKKDGSRKFILDFTSGGEELKLESKDIEYNSNLEEGTNIIVSSLHHNTIKQIKNEFHMATILNQLGRMYSKFIIKKKLIISVNGVKVEPKNIKARKLPPSKTSQNYKVDLYKGEKDDISGIDVFVNDYMIYNRKKGKETGWNLLNETKYTYTNCIVEVTYYGDMKKFKEEESKLFKEVIQFVKSNKKYFKSNTIIIQYDRPIKQVEQLKEYYDENTAKAIGIKGFEKLYENYLYNKKIF